MNDSVLAEVAKTAERLGGPIPLWLKEKELPDFQALEQGESGPELILLHGLFGALSNWDTCLPLFAEFSKATALEFPIVSGHRSGVRIKALAAYTECFLRIRNLEKVVLCGNSLGGHVALRLALASPDRVSALILAGSSGLYEHSVDSLPVRPGEKFIREHMKRVFYHPEFITDKAVDEIHSILQRRMNHLNLIHAARSAKKDNLQAELKDIRCPTLLLWGREDEVTTMKVAEQFHQYIPNSELTVIDKCGHAPMIEHPQWFADQVQAFLKKHSLLPS